MKNEIEHRYLDALKELKSILDYTPRLSLNEFARKKNLNNRLGCVLRNGGIIKTEGHGKSTKNYWSTKVEPNIEMSRKVLDELYKMSLASIEKRNKTKTRKNYKPRVEGHKNYKNALEELKKLTKHKTRLNQTDFAKKWGISSYFFIGCVNSGIVSRTPCNKNSFFYTWIGGDVTDNMVTKVKKSVNETHTRIIEKQPKQQNTIITTSSKNQSKTVVKSYLWGMFKKVVTVE